MVPSPRERPTEYVVALASAVLAVLAVLRPLPPDLTPALLALVGVCAPLVTWIASWWARRPKA